MQVIKILKGVPASGKSFYCQQLMKEEPNKWRRINNDSLRLSLDFGVYSVDNEKTIRSARDFLIKECLAQGCNLIIDNVNAGKNYEEVCKIVQEANIDCQVVEVPFFIELDDAISRDANREGKVGAEVIKKFWKQLGGKQFAFYKPRIEIFSKRQHCVEAPFVPAIQDKKLVPSLISDLDGTLSLFAGKRSPYCAKDCDLIDDINTPVAETIKMYYDQNYKIIFCSGREDKYELETRRFIEKHLGKIDYDLWMRKSGDFRKDSLVKEEIYHNHIEGKYWVKFVLDDRDQIVKLWRSLGLICWQVADGNF